MSTDFSIKPVGSPVAAPIVQPIREAAKQAVQTELPASVAVTAADAGPVVRFDSNVVSSLEPGGDRPRRRFHRLPGGRQPHERGGEAIS